MTFPEEIGKAIGISPNTCSETSSPAPMVVKLPGRNSRNGKDLLTE